MCLVSQFGKDSACGIVMYTWHSIAAGSSRAGAGLGVGALGVIQSIRLTGYGGGCMCFWACDRLGCVAMIFTSIAPHVDDSTNLKPFGGPKSILGAH